MPISTSYSENDEFGRASTSWKLTSRFAESGITPASLLRA